MNREDILDLCYSVQTLSDIAVAKEARSSYLHQYPNDKEVFELGEMLAMIEDALQLMIEDIAVHDKPVATVA